MLDSGFDECTLDAPGCSVDAESAFDTVCGRGVCKSIPPSNQDPLLDEFESKRECGWGL